jgi:hypothetical protein
MPGRRVYSFIIGLLLCGLQCAWLSGCDGGSDSGGSPSNAPDVPANASDAAAETTADRTPANPTPLAIQSEVACEFLLAMVNQDQARIRELSIERENMHVLWQGGPIPPQERERVTREIAMLQFRRAKAGDTVPLPGGGSFVAGPQIDNVRKSILIPVNPAFRDLLFVMEVKGGMWKVDPSALIAARMTAIDAQTMTGPEVPVVDSP